MLTPYRRHNEQCKYSSRSEYRCKCPVWVAGTDPRTQKHIRESLKTRDWTKAQEVVRKWEIDGQRIAERRPLVTVTEWRDAFLADAEARKLSPETLRKYRHVFQQLEAFAEKHGIRLAEDMNLAALTAFRSTWKDGPLSSLKKLERLRSMYKFAARRKWVEENWAADLKKPTVKDNPTLPFTDVEMKAILHAAKKSTRYGVSAVYAFILAMRYSGLRISDVTILRRDALTGSRLRLRTAKTGADVSVTLPAAVADLLRKVISKTPEHFFWTGTSKVPAAVSVWRKRLAEVFEDAGIKKGHSHRFRDTFAVALLDAGVSIENVSTLLGNSVKIVQKHYAPWVKSRQDALDKAVASASLEAIL